MDTRIIAVLFAVMVVAGIGVFYISSSGHGLLQSGSSTVSGSQSGTTSYPPCTQNCNHNGTNQNDTGNKPPPCTQNCGQPPSNSPPNGNQTCTQNCNNGGSQGSGSQITVKSVSSSYKVLQQGSVSAFFSAQPAAIMLSGIGFNTTGGPLTFNHPGGIATDGQHLLLVDKENNRILVWNRIPTSATTPPDIVLGQPNFYSNNVGHGLNGLAFPTQVSTANGKVVVADTFNNRILIWNSFPTSNDQPADLEIYGNLSNPLLDINWPWGAWTDGTKLVVSSTAGGRVLVWKSFPTKDNQSADFYLSNVGNIHIGTPRQITSDGRYLMVGDHNPVSSSNGNSGSTQLLPGSFVWDSFPAQTNQSYSYFLPSNQWDKYGFDWFRGTILQNGTALLLGSKLNIFSAFPQSNSSVPTAMVGGPSTGGGVTSAYDAGDGSDVAVAGSRLFMALYNPNMIAVFNQIPSTSGAAPDFTIGAPSLFNSTLASNYYLTNPQPATNGKSLFAVSDFDQKMYVYKSIPDQSGAHPDYVYSFVTQPQSIALYNNTLAVAASQGTSGVIYIWHQLPLQGQMPDTNLTSIGGIKFSGFITVAMDSGHFYVADRSANKVYVWNGTPSASSQPYATISLNGPSGMSSDGKHLVVDAGFSSYYMYDVSALGNNAAPSGNLTIQNPLAGQPISGKLQNGFGIFGQSGNPIVYGGHLFIADLGRNRVLIWNNITSAMHGAAPDATLGCLQNVTVCDTTPGISNTTLFWPSYLAYDGSHLWVGEYKFSGRLLRFDGD